MFTTTTLTLFLAASANAFPIWSRFSTRDTSTPTKLAQGTNFYFDSLHLEDQCTPGQIACISSNLAKCSPEGTWEITPCTGNSTCLAVPSSDNGLLVQCMLFTDAQAAIGDENVSWDQGVTEAPMNTATAVASPTPTESTSESAAPTDTATETATDAPTEATPTDAPVDPSSTCTEEPEATETQTITVILVPNPTESGAFVTSTLEPSVTEPVEEPSVTGTDAVVAPTETSSESAEPTCTETPEDPEATETDGAEEPTETDSEGAEPTETSTEGEEPTETSTEGEEPTETSTEGAAPTDEITTETSSEGVTLTIAPASPSPSPSSSVSVPEVIVGGTHFIPSPSPSAPAKMRRVRRST